MSWVCGSRQLFPLCLHLVHLQSQHADLACGRWSLSISPVRRTRGLHLYIDSKKWYLKASQLFNFNHFTLCHLFFLLASLLLLLLLRIAGLSPSEPNFISLQLPFNFRFQNDSTQTSSHPSNQPFLYPSWPPQSPQCLCQILQAHPWSLNRLWPESRKILSVKNQL